MLKTFMHESRSPINIMEIFAQLELIANSIVRSRDKIKATSLDNRPASKVTCSLDFTTDQGKSRKVSGSFVMSQRQCITHTMYLPLWRRRSQIIHNKAHSLD